MSSGGIEDQTKLVMDNLTAVLAANGMTMANVVSTTVYMKDLNDFAKRTRSTGAMSRTSLRREGPFRLPGCPEAP